MTMPGGYGNTGHTQSQMGQLQTLVEQYNGIDNVPQNLLRNAGFSGKQDAIQSMMNMGATARGSQPTDALAKAAGVGATGLGAALVGGLQLANTITAGTGLPTKQGQTPTGAPMPAQIWIPPKSNAVPTTQQTAGIKDDYAAQFGPNSGPAAGSGLQDVTPIAGGVQYGMPGGSTYHSNMPDSSSYSPSTGSNPTSTGSDLPAAPSYSDYIKNLVAPTLQDIPDAPAYTPIVAKDFTPQASKMAATAYSPAFAAIDLGVSNAKQNYANSDAQIQGIYADLGKALLANQTASDARYATQKKENAADTLAAQQQAAALNKAGTATRNAGGSMGAPPALTAGLNAASNADSNYQVNALAQTALRNQGAESDLQDAAANQQTSYQDAAQAQGAFTRQQLSFDLANMLTGYDQQRLNLTSDEKNRILDLANTLSNNDVNIQGQNQSNKMNAYQQAVAAIQARNANAQTGYQNQVNAADTAYKNQYGSWLDDAQMRMKAQEDATQNAQFIQSELDKRIMNTENNQTDIAKAQAAGGAAAAEQLKNDPYTKFTTAVQSYFPGDTATARKATDAAFQLISQKYWVQNTKPNAQQLMQDAVQLADQTGLPQQTMWAVAAALLNSGLTSGYSGGLSLSGNNNG